MWVIVAQMEGAPIPIEIEKAAQGKGEGDSY